MMNRCYRLNEPDVSAEDFKSEILALDLKSGYYHSLREAAVPIWRFLMLGLTEEEINRQLETFYAVKQGSLAEAVASFLQALDEGGVIVPRPEPVSPAASTLSESLADLPTLYVPPLLETYTDMQDLLKLDPIHDVDVAGWPHVPETPAA